MQIPIDKKWIILEKEDYADYLFVVSTWEAFTIKNPEYGFENCQWLSAEYINKACNLFLPLDVYQKISRKYLEKLFTSPKVWHKLHRENIYFAKKTIILASKIKRLHVQKLSNKQLIQWLQKFEDIQRENHDRRGPMFIIEVKDNLFSNYLMEYLRERIEDLKVKISPLESFRILTTPSKKSIIKKQQEELAKIALMRNKKAQMKALNHHTRKYEWLEYGLQGKILHKGHFRKELLQIIRRGARRLVRYLAREINQVRKKQREIINKLKIHSLHQSLFKVARDSIYCKVFSKDAQFYSYYATENLFKEIGRRGGLTLEQVKFLTFPEYNQILFYQKDLSQVANERMRYSLHFSYRGKTVIYQGGDAKKIRKRLKFYEEKNILSSKSVVLQGNSAYPGRVRGKVKIINTTQEMMKMHRGDVLVSHMTNPDIVYAMKIACAIVTDLGGITCHAAIISRELNIPCIIATKIATQVFKDGDLVEVDAERGIVKKL